jgi:RHS repeat-associated protein
VDNAHSHFKEVYIRRPVSVTRYYYFGAQRVAMRKDGMVYWLVADHLGTTSLVLDAAGNKVAESRHLPYGEERWTSGTLPTDYRFTGQRQEIGLGLYHMGARFYDAYLARWLSADTIVPKITNPQAWNRYSYVGGNPLRFVDPTGHLTDDQIKEYTDYNTDEELDKLKNDNRELYQMLCYLHLGDWLPWGTDYYEAILIEGDLFFVPYSIDGDMLEAGDLIDAESYLLMRSTPNGIEYPYRWVKGQDPVIDPRLSGDPYYQKISKGEKFRRFNVWNAVGSGLIGTGVGLLTSLLTGPVGPVVGFFAGVAVDLAVEAAPVPPGKEIGDEVYGYYCPDGWVEITIIRDGEVVSHEWTTEP